MRRSSSQQPTETHPVPGDPRSAIGEEGRMSFANGHEEWTRRSVSSDVCGRGAASWRRRSIGHHPRRARTHTGQHEIRVARAPTSHRTRPDPPPLQRTKGCQRDGMTSARRLTGCSQCSAFRSSARGMRADAQGGASRVGSLRACQPSGDFIALTVAISPLLPGSMPALVSARSGRVVVLCPRAISVMPGAECTE